VQQHDRRRPRSGVGGCRPAAWSPAGAATLARSALISSARRSSVRRRRLALIGRAGTATCETSTTSYVANPFASSFSASSTTAIFWPAPHRTHPVGPQHLGLVLLVSNPSKGTLELWSPLRRVPPPCDRHREVALSCCLRDNHSCRRVQLDSELDNMLLLGQFS
jgi:hypothetical protein